MATDWEALKAEYASSDMTQADICEKYGLSPKNVADHSRHDGWVAARKKYRKKVAEKALRKATTKDANKLAKLIVTTEKAVDKVSALFDDPQQFNRYLVENVEEYAEPVITLTPDEDGQEMDRKAIGMRKWTEEKVFTKTDTKALKDAVMMLEKLTGLVRNLYGIPTQAEEEAQRIAAERLEMDKKRADAADNSDATIEVVFDAGEESWNA